MASTGDQKNEAPILMVVEDDGTTRKMVTKLFQTAGFDAISFASGDEAAEYLGLGENSAAAPPPTVKAIVTDFSMPGITGYELLRKVKEAGYEAVKSIPVFVTSSEDEVEEQIMAGGAAGFVNKPMTHEKVKKIRDQLLL